MEYTYIEYDDSGEATATTEQYPDDMDSAQAALRTEWGAEKSKALRHLEVEYTGARKNPNNTHGPFLLFWMTPLEEQVKHFHTIIEVGGFWRRGVGVRIGKRIYGAWVPTGRPRPSKSVRKIGGSGPVMGPDGRADISIPALRESIK